MAIEISTLKTEREVLQKDFDNLSGRIKQVDADLITMKSNLNAIYGAIQQVDKLIAKDSEEQSEKQLLTEKDKVMPAEKQAALNVATS
jgi:septal ring factor EnvC (AmiA/AmiB activator)|tara:strand:- start:574 stop:837 length:264 start_codon:yes stop_codon:yes gene_type:complete